MISIDRAIDKLIALEKRLAVVWFADDDDKDAVTLGKEALERVKACRHEYGCPLVDPEGDRPEDILAKQSLPTEIPF